MIDEHFARSAAYPEFEMEVRWIERHLPSRARRILDVGCGGGGTLVRLAGRQVMGVDPCPDGLKVTRQVVPRAPLVCADGCALPFAAVSFDAVIVQHVVEHMPSALSAMSEWHRVLATGGVLLVVTPNARFADPSVFDDETHVHIYQKQDIGALALASGFSVLDLRSIGLPWFRNDKGKRGLWRARRWVLDAAQALSGIIGLRWRGQSLCCAAMKPA